MLTETELTAALVERHGEANQKKLRTAVVGIAGLGGLGSNIAVHLARLGVGTLVLADFDCVDVTNLNRQHYTMRDLVRPKTEALTEQLREINPYLTYITHAVRVTPENAARLFGGCTVVCEAFDRADQKAMLIETLLSALPETPLVAGSGMAGCGSANAIQTRRSFGHLYLCGDQTSDLADGLPLMAPRVAVCAAQQATMALRLILGETQP
ncbi:MAG: sulfur carrier protein ThiS adenylyltransferase ThiF [Intestinibacillus sp.]